jgi:hypothetical protein
MPVVQDVEAVSQLNSYQVYNEVCYRIMQQQQITSYIEHSTI